MLWNIEGAVKTVDSSCHDFSTHHIVALTETLSTTGVLSSNRTWINSVARKNSTIGRPSGGLAIGLSDAVSWREKTCFVSNSIIAVDPFRFVFCVCYFQPKTAIIDIVDDFTRALSSISPCTKPLLVCGDFNCLFDSGSRGEDLVEAMFTCGLTCVSDGQTMTYIAPQGSSCIDLVFVSRHHSHLVDVSVAGSLEKKHQHVSIIFKIVPDIADHRSKAIRRINPDVLQCSFVPSLFDNNGLTRSAAVRSQATSSRSVHSCEVVGLARR